MRLKVASIRSHGWLICPLTRLRLSSALPRPKPSHPSPRWGGGIVIARRVDHFDNTLCLKSKVAVAAILAADVLRLRPKYSNF